MNPGRLICPALRWDEATGFAHEEPRIAEALELGAGGFILFGGTVAAVRDLTGRLRRDASRPLLLAADLERGAGQQIRGLAELPPPLALAALADPGVLRAAGFLTAVQALGVGVNWVLAPVADLDVEPENPIVQTRAFSGDAEDAAAAVANWVAGCEAGGAIACAKHFPGHGRTLGDSHDSVPRVAAGAETLREQDMAPFRSAVGVGVRSIMTAHVAYPALDPSGAPATFSPPILNELREGLRFEGLIVSDALMMAGARHEGGTGAAAVAAVTAGVDLLLYPEDPRAAAGALAEAVGRDPAIARRVEASLGRYEAALASLSGPLTSEFDDQPGSAAALGHWLLSRPLARGPEPALRAPIELVVADDDLGGRYPPSTGSDGVRAELERRGVGVGPGGSSVVLLFAEPRASKGRAGLGEESRATLARRAPGCDLVIVFGHPRLAAEVPAGPPVLVAWHRQPLMQRAAARWLAERLT